MENITKKVIKNRVPKTKYNLINSIQNRFSPRVFNCQSITEDEICTIFEAARLAPSGRNHQPWKFFVIFKKSNSYLKLLKSIPERNLIWANTAPLLVIACYDETEETEGVNKWAQYDLGQAVISLVLQAQNMNIYSRQIGSFDCEKVATDFNFDKYSVPFVIIAMGKMGNDYDYSKADPSIVEKEVKPWERKEKIFEILK